jgi:leucyl-tRNA synthetase
MVCKEVQTCPSHGNLYPEEVVEGRCSRCKAEVVTGKTVKMSKSMKNVVDPQELVNQYGADTVRMFCLFAAPPERDLEWNDQGVEGASRFIHRVWRLVDDNLESIQKVGSYQGEGVLTESLKGLHRKTHETIKKVTDDIEDRFHFNTAISAVMELVNEINRFLLNSDVKDDKAWPVVREAIETTILLLSPVVPHLCESLWQRLSHGVSLLTEPWPVYRQNALEVDKRIIVLQVNGKVRNRIEVPASVGKAELESLALNDERVKRFIQDKKVRKVVVVKNKLVNVVA